MENRIHLGDCIDVLHEIQENSVDLVYLDPPFFTGKRQASSNKDGSKKYTYEDRWHSNSDYYDFIEKRLTLCRKVMKDTASIFFHCDRNAVHIARYALDKVFGPEAFQSEIIWSYKRWSNAKKGLLQQHQNILFYSKTNSFKWNKTFVDYSATTNIDQILQRRKRDDRGKSAYLRDKEGNVVLEATKEGVPLGDVWDIPYLNPKAKERTGYPTQKPILLLERIIALTTDEGDIVLDPFCGSGTTPVAANMLNRKYIGIDKSIDAVHLTNDRLLSPIKSESNLLKKGVESFLKKDQWIEMHLTGLECNPVHRNSGADALLKEKVNGNGVFIKVQKQEEKLNDALNKLVKLINSREGFKGILIQTSNTDEFINNESKSIKIIKSISMQIREF
ncbi:DNA modification methyltransferase [Pantoea sp. AS-PWVM4]|uniref:DNA-methyltransferase n=1 Tax=Pantoea sp. AS-PWVM4 TaxID=1332069 RepID=UPI0003AC6B23|nr:site-specific DNA-methyltransferase [Pantoea sp. AS-PWVM4]ERK17325.1 DNA modification methyltransferase [Pantoea sp. AS-PWVM4]